MPGPTKKEIALDDFLTMTAVPSNMTLDDLEFDEASGIVVLHLTARTVEAPE